MQHKFFQPGVILLISLLSVIEGIGIVNSSKAGEGQGGWYLIFLGILLAGLTIFHFITEMRTEEPASQMNSKTVRKIKLFLLIFLGYVILTTVLGYMLSTVLFFLCHLRFLGEYKWKSVSWMSLAFGVSLGLIFMYAGMSLPESIIPWP